MTEKDFEAWEERAARNVNAPASDVDDLGGEVLLLIAEVRRLRVDNAEMALKWIPPGIAKQACLDGQDAVVEKLARLVESELREPEVAEFIRDAWRKAGGVR
jgi:hypothetical protein